MAGPALLVANESVLSVGGRQFGIRNASTRIAKPIVERPRSAREPQGCPGNGDCDDSDPCRTGVCINGQCVYTLLVCNGGDACATDACVNGECVSTPVDCDDGNACTIDVCVNGECVYTPTECEGDGNPGGEWHVFEHTPTGDRCGTVQFTYPKAVVLVDGSRFMFINGDDEIVDDLTLSSDLEIMSGGQVIGVVQFAIDGAGRNILFALGLNGTVLNGDLSASGMQPSSLTVSGSPPCDACYHVDAPPEGACPDIPVDDPTFDDSTFSGHLQLLKTWDNSDYGIGPTTRTIGLTIRTGSSPLVVLDYYDRQYAIGSGGGHFPFWPYANTTASCVASQFSISSEAVEVQLTCEGETTDYGYPFETSLTVSGARNSSGMSVTVEEQHYFDMIGSAQWDGAGVLVPE